MRSGSIRAATLSVVPALALLGLTAVAANAVTLTFRNDISPLQMQWKGANAVYMGFGEMPEGTAKGMNSALSTIEYDRAQDSGIKIARTWYGQDWALPSYPSTSGGYQWRSTKMTALKSWLGAMQRRNIDVGLNMGWTFPLDICGVANWNDRAHVSPCTPTTGDESTFAHWVSDSLNQLINVDGYTNVKYIFLFTEANGPYGDGGYPVNPATRTTWAQNAYYVHIADMVDDQIRADDASRTRVRPQVKIVGPDESTQMPAARGSNPFTQYVVANASSDTFDIYSTHKYCIGTVPGSGDCPTYAQWISQFSPFVTTASTKPLWADELGADVSADPSAWRRTPAYGVYMADATAGLATAGVNAEFAWQLQDQWFAAPIDAAYQHYGLARWLGESTDAYPAYYAYALMGNLLGGRANGANNTWVYQTDGSTTTLHGMSIGMGTGVSPCTITGGCASAMIVNDASTPQTAQFDFATAGRAPGSTFYRYVFNGGNSPRPTPDKSAYMPHWDRQYTGVTTGIPSDVIPANSVVIYSTVDLGGPAATNLAPDATATASSTQSGYAAANVNDRDISQTAGGTMSWEPLSTSSGSQYVELDWASAQTFDHVDVDLTATNKLTQYTLQYWNGSAWTNFSPAVNVTSNDTAHRTHTFTAVSSSKLRLTVPSPTSPPVNEISVYDDSGTPDTALGFTATTDSTASTTNKYEYEKVSTAARTFQSGDTIEYDVKLVDNLAQIGGIDVSLSGTACGASRAMRDATGWADQNGITGHPGGDISGRAYAAWYHRVLRVPTCAVGLSSTGWMLASEQDGKDPSLALGVKGTAFYDNIVVKDRTGAVVTTAYASGGPETVQNYLGTHYASIDLFVTPQSP